MPGAWDRQRAEAVRDAQAIGRLDRTKRGVAQKQGALPDVTAVPAPNLQMNEGRDGEPEDDNAQRGVSDEAEAPISGG